MDITQRVQDDITTIAFTGHLDTNTSPDAQKALDEILEAGGSKILVDFTALDFISSAGLRVLLATTKRLTRAGGKLHIFGLNETAQEIFDISGFSTIFAVFRTEADALKGF